jgi:glutamate/tyrosine decarboxylase-like PLP-dependent enzyme
LSQNISQAWARVGELIADVFERYRSEPPLPEGLSHARVSACFQEGLPKSGRSTDEVLDLIARYVIPSSLNLANPMAFGLMTPHPLPFSVMVDSLASALNQNLGCAWTTAPSAIELELQLVRWFGELLRLGIQVNGHVTSGGTMSNFTGLRIAVHRAAPDLRFAGMHTTRRFTIYTSDQAHFSIERAAGLLGIGENNVRRIQTTSDLSIDVEALDGAIERDRDNGLEPLAIVGMAGTTATGAIDPLRELANLSQSQQVWFHVDAAYGGALAFSERLRPALAGVELADSLTLDPHKWMFVPFSIGVFLTRHPNLLRSAFGHQTEYLGGNHLTVFDDAPSGFYELSFEASRRFNGLKLWAELMHLGTDGFSRLIEKQVALTDALVDRLRATPTLEIAPRFPLNIVCFRLAGDDYKQEQFQRLVENEAKCWLSNVSIKGKRFVRLNLLHPGLEREHVELLGAAVQKASKQLATS